MIITTVAERCQNIIATLRQVIVGKDEALEQILLGLLANGHILIEDYPGLAKTLIAHLCTQVLDLACKRIQFTPDLLPSDVTGSFLYNQREGTLRFGTTRCSRSCFWPTRSIAPLRKPRWSSLR